MSYWLKPFISGRYKSVFVATVLVGFDLELLAVKAGTIIAKQPACCLCRHSVIDSDNDVRPPRKRVLDIELRRARGVVRVRVVNAQELQVEFLCAMLGIAVLSRRDDVPARAILLHRVSQLKNVPYELYISFA